MRLWLLHVFTAALAVAANPAGAQGLRADAHVGLDELHSDGESETGVTYGLTLGYDLGLRQGLVGVQLDLDATDNGRCESDVFLAGDRACIDARRDTALSLRAGAFVAGSTLVYATAGYANARFDARYEAAGVGTSDHETLDGVRLGAGIEANISRRLYGKFEYRYTNYQDGVSRQQGIVGLGLRF